MATSPKRSFKLVTGIFQQDEPQVAGPAVDSDVLNARRTSQIEPRFGLIGEEWPDLDVLNANAPRGTTYKLLIVARHGQGWHNVAEAKYRGDPAWRTYWARINGDDELTWGPDPLLTDIGIAQAHTAAAFWSTHDCPQPTLYMCSPLRRCIQTFLHTFPAPAKAVIHENLREPLAYEGQTLNFRLPVSTSKEYFGHADRLDWTGMVDDEDRRTGIVETRDMKLLRARTVLEELFDKYPDEHVVSFTSHFGFIESLTIVLGRPWQGLPTGGIAPFLIQAVETPPLPN